MQLNISGGNEELRLSPEAVVQEKHRQYSSSSIFNLADLPCWGFHTELLWQGNPWLTLRHLCAPKCWMAASSLMASQPNSSWNGRSLMSWTTTETLNTIFPHRTALSALSLTRWLSLQHFSQLILMSWPKSHFYSLSSGIVNRQQQNNIHLFLLFFEHFIFSAASVTSSLWNTSLL